MTKKSFKDKLLISLQLSRAFRLVWESAPGTTAANLVLSFVQGLLPIVSLYLTKLIIDAVTNGIRATDKTESFRQLIVLIAIAGGVTLLTYLCQTFGNYVRQAQALTVQDHLSSLIHEKSVQIDLEFFENSRYHDSLHRAIQDSNRSVSIVTNLAQLLQNGISIIAISGLLFSMHWLLAIILILTVVPGVLVKIKYSEKIFKWQRSRTAMERKSRYFHWILTGELNAKEVRLFELGREFIERFRRVRQKIRQEQLSIESNRARTEFTTQASAAILGTGIYAFFVYRTIHGLISLGDMVMYYQAFQRSQTFLKNTLSSLAALYEANLFLTNLYEFLDLKPRISENPHPLHLPTKLKSGISFENMSFRYPGDSREILHNINLNIRPGEKLALVGENGVGKTTFIKLLCRLYDPTEGRIAFDGIDVRDFSLSDLRRFISVIFQDYVKYHLTARENIRIGDLSLPPDAPKIETCAQMTGAHKVIEQLPRGYDTVLGRSFEKGNELSIGEWQKLAVARAFLRDSQLIVLDEPTSAMDAKAEYELFMKFNKLTRDRSAILISHRFSTVKMADNICVLEKGKIIEYGSHQQLMTLGGTYSRLFNMQASFYNINLPKNGKTFSKIQAA